MDIKICTDKWKLNIYQVALFGFLHSGTCVCFSHTSYQRKWKTCKAVKLRVGLYDVFNPVEELTHFDIDSRVVGQSASLTPRHQTMQLPKTHQRAAGVTLHDKHREPVWAVMCWPILTIGICCKTHIANVSASVHVPSAHHPACDHARIGFGTVHVIHYGYVQALQTVGHARWTNRDNVKTLILSEWMVNLQDKAEIFLRQLKNMYRLLMKKNDIYITTVLATPPQLWHQ